MDKRTEVRKYIFIQLCAIVLVIGCVAIDTVFYLKTLGLKAELEQLQLDTTERDELLQINQALIKEVQKLRQENEMLNSQLKDWLQNWQVEEFKVTAYTLQDGNGDGYTASMTVPAPGRTAAVDPAVIPLRTRIYIPGYGWRVAEDTGGAVRGNVIDLYMGSGAAALEEACRWGRREMLVLHKKPVNEG